MKLNLPTYIAAPAAARADAWLDRDGALEPLSLRFDPHDIRAGAPPAGLGEAEARAMVEIARDHRPIAAAAPPDDETLRELRKGLSAAAAPPDDETLRELRKGLSAAAAPPRKE